MKKLYLRNPWKKHADKRSREGANKKSKSKPPRSSFLAQHKQHYKDQGIPLPQKGKGGIRTIKAPEVFSLIQNTDRTLAFFEQIWGICERSPIYIDLSDVTEITTESILYLLSILDRLKSRDHKKIKGNYPKDMDCRRLLCSSGFTNYIKTSDANRIHSEDVLEIIHGNEVNPVEIAKIEKFIREKLKIPRNEATQSIHVVLLECVGNTYDHAYNKDATKSMPYQAKWWAMAHYQQGMVSCSVLDNGAGIPATMKKKFLEAVKFWGREEHILLFKAFTEPARSRLELEFRGKGLPKIYELVCRDYLKNVRVVSNKAFVNLSNLGENKKLQRPLKGTLYSFEFTTNDQNIRRDKNYETEIYEGE